MKIIGFKYIFYSLKTRLIIILLLTALFPLLLLGTVSYLSIQSIIHQKMENGIHTTLNQTKLGLENTLSNMEYTSLQLSNEGSVGQKLESLQSSQSYFDQLHITNEIQNNINLVNFTNPYLGVMLYYFSDEKKVRFQSLEVIDNFNLDQLPLLAEYKGVLFYGPHKTKYKYGNNIVFSLVRPVPVPGNKHTAIYVYIETNLKLFEKILNQNQFGMSASNIVFNQNGVIAYSDDQEHFPLGTAYDVIQNINAKKPPYKGYYLFKETSDQGWSIAVAIKKKDFDSEFHKWLIKYGAISCISLIVSILLALLVWKTVYLPLKKIHKEIQLMADNRFDSTIKLTRIKEFDNVLYEFHHARTRILGLFGEIEQKERARAHLEVEKLMYQINPHFIHNTLNTIQWLARMEGHKEIDRLVSIFTRLLHYNLGKEGRVVLLKHEIEAMQDYIALQRIRYDHDFNVSISIEESLMIVEVPRFILQPLVENALYHGLGDKDGSIEVNIRTEADQYMILEVKDNGAGMTPQEISRLLADDKSEHQKAGLGIGLNYVNRMIKDQYGDACEIQIESKIGAGTLISLRIPLHHVRSG
jgi:two-component system sensor histidine kinase YesM